MQRFRHQLVAPLSRSLMRTTEAVQAFLQNELVKAQPIMRYLMDHNQPLRSSSKFHEGLEAYSQVDSLWQIQLAWREPAISHTVVHPRLMRRVSPYQQMETFQNTLQISRIYLMASTAVLLLSAPSQWLESRIWLLNPVQADMETVLLKAMG